MIQFTQSVGVSPGTTTMQLGDCPLDPRRGYTAMPVVQAGAVEDPEGTIYDPYAEVERLRGLRGLGVIAPPRWGLVLFAGLAVFTGVLGYRRWRR